MRLTHLSCKCVVDDGGLVRNMDSMFARGLPLCVPLPERAGRLAVVGAGPSVRDYLDELPGYDEVWAVNGAYNYLLEQGIIPDGFVAVDPLPGLAEYVGSPDCKTTFYICGFCDPSVFDALKDHKVEVWFSAQPGMKYRDKTWLVPGGTTALTRAPALAKMLGWRDVTVYGADCSFDELGRYAYEDGTYKEDSVAEVSRVMCNDEGPFYTERALLNQASQLGCLAQQTVIKLTFRCGGLLDVFLRAPTLDRDLHAEYDKAVAAQEEQNEPAHISS